MNQGRWIWIAALAMLTVAGVGCGQATDGDKPMPNKLASQIEQGIQGGQVDTQDKFLVAVLRTSGRGGLCSGTLIAPNLVLTAQHCVSSLSSQYGIQCGRTTFTGTYSASSFVVSTETDVLDRQRPPNEYFRAAQIYIPPGGNGVCGRDIALIRLRSNVPSSLTQPLDPAFNKSDYTPGSVYSALGYGHTGSGRGSGTRRILGNRKINCFGNGCGFRAQSTEFIGDGGTCQGDSGGGAIKGGKVLGALSRGASGCRSALYTTTHGWRAWIQQVAQQASAKGGYSPPSWSSSGPDSDGDGISDKFDNCPSTANQSQSDMDGDGQGDKCDSDTDGDGVRDGADNCQETKNKAQKDTNGNGQGDVCDTDRDGDGVENTFDNCPKVPNPKQEQSDADGSGDACDDSDNDGVKDIDDNCMMTPNASQTDSDGDGTGDACESGGSGSTSGSTTSGTTSGSGSSGTTSGSGSTSGSTTSGTTSGSGSSGTTSGTTTSGTTSGSGSTSGSTTSGTTGTSGGSGTTGGSGSTGSGAGTGSATGGTSGGTTGGSGQNTGPQPVLIVDEGNSDDSGCSAAGDADPTDWSGALLLGLLGLGLMRRRREER